MNTLKYIGFASLIVIGLLLKGCFGGGPTEPLPDLISALKDVPTYSIVLDDMKEEGTFSPQYFQKFRLVVPKPTQDGSTGSDDEGQTSATLDVNTPGVVRPALYAPGAGLPVATAQAQETAPPAAAPAVRTEVTDWREVPEDWYRKTQQFLGLTIYSQTDGKPSQQVGPAGYEYVGNPHYGRWRERSDGSRIWEFFAGYAMMNMLLGNRPVYYRDYQDYRGYRGRPYYGPMGSGGRPSYGTQGTVTQQQKPTFYQRRMARQAASNRSFSDRVSNRIGRTRTGLRGRSGGFGK